MIREKLPAIDDLSDYDKMVLLEELLSELEVKVLPEPDPQVIAILRARWEDYLRNPESAIPGEEFLRRLRGQRPAACAK